MSKIIREPSRFTRDKNAVVNREIVNQTSFSPITGRVQELLHQVKRSKLKLQHILNLKD